MSTFNALSGKIEVVKAVGQTYFVGKSDEEILNEYKSEALQQLKTDISLALNIAYDDTETFDAISGTTQVDLSIALGHLQAYLMFMNVFDGQGTASEQFARYHLNQYEKQRMKFSGLLSTASPMIYTRLLQFG